MCAINHLWCSFAERFRDLVEHAGVTPNNFSLIYSALSCQRIICSCGSIFLSGVKYFYKTESRKNRVVESDNV